MKKDDFVEDFHSIAHTALGIVLTFSLFVRVL